MNTKSKEMAFAELKSLLEAGASAKALQDLDFSKLQKSKVTGLRDRRDK